MEISLTPGQFNLPSVIVIDEPENALHSVAQLTGCTPSIVVNPDDGLYYLQGCKC